MNPLPILPTLLLPSLPSLSLQLLRRHPDVVASIALSDPVCFLICLPRTLFSFVYKSPWAETVLQTVLEAGRWILCGRELQVARSLRDGFNW